MLISLCFVNGYHLPTVPEAARDDGTCRRGRIDAEAIIYEG